MSYNVCFLSLKCTYFRDELDNFTTCLDGEVHVDSIKEIYIEKKTKEKLPCSISMLTLKQHALVDLTAKTGFYKYAKLTIQLPSIIKVSESSYIYTVWNFIGEFGGWVGICLGSCVADFAAVVELILFKMRENMFMG